MTLVNAATLSVQLLRYRAQLVELALGLHAACVHGGRPIEPDPLGHVVARLEFLRQQVPEQQFPLVAAEHSVMLALAHAGEPAFAAELLREATRLLGVVVSFLVDVECGVLEAARKRACGATGRTKELRQ